ncbi:Glycoprotein M [Eptesicus fuscus gammaherpesvirus]|uniref:Glycoprotein M n=1 Tax=vespertilionid gammaherpesvirus 3 TaxID=2846598 RepID=A0A2D1A8T5_9GAMA|nr:Glycoprotein M [Eptesicus fuscus gammaherpesvirus]ATA58268.1 Glycoprotein M [Eptesicus fuscus gammaherpesvirus]WAH70907.1 envelope glycoprotein M [Eptesicus fuscus gammaherpesvirus]
MAGFKIPASRSDQFIHALWVKMLILYFVMFFLAAVVPFAAMVPGLGFPCYFNTVVNYSALNLTARNTAKHLTPILFLEAPEMFMYIAFSFFVDVVAAAYYAMSTWTVSLAKRDHVTRLNSVTQWIYLSGSPTLVFMGLLRLWTFQLFIQTLSYKNIFLAAFVYGLHFLLSFAHMQSYISRNAPAWEVSSLERQVPEGTAINRHLRLSKPLTANLHLACLGVETLVFSLSFMVAIGNSFYTPVADIIFGAVNLYLVMSLFWYAFTEIYLQRYMQYQIGYYLGIMAGSVFLSLPLVRYEHVFLSAKVHSAVATNIAAVPLLAALALALRLTRARYGTRRVAYVPVKSSASVAARAGCDEDGDCFSLDSFNEETAEAGATGTGASRGYDSGQNKRGRSSGGGGSERKSGRSRKQQPTGPALMESGSEEEEIF